MSVDPPKSNAVPNDEADRVPEGTVSSERMHEVLRRLAQNHYGSPEVQDKVARAVLQNLGNHDLLGALRHMSARPAGESTSGPTPHQELRRAIP